MHEQFLAISEETLSEHTNFVTQCLICPLHISTKQQIIIFVTTKRQNEKLQVLIHIYYIALYIGRTNLLHFNVVIDMYRFPN